MNSNVHPLIVALVLALTALAIGTWVWGSGAAANIGGPSELRTAGNGHVYIQIQNYLVEHDADGNFVATHDLHDISVDLFLGAFDFFSNGDVLLRRGPDPRSFGDNLRAYQRKTNKQSIDPDNIDSGLFRCELETKMCSRFGQMDFKAAHGIYIDRRSDEVYVSDTTRHVIRKYSQDGNELAEPKAGFDFPNQILIHHDKLYVADTNHHEVRIVSADTADFGDTISRQNVAPPLATSARQIWPSHIARVGRGWWVNNMRTGMNQGGIYVFDDEWRLTRKLDMPEDADPISLSVLGDEVWVSDWYNDKIRRFSTAGESLGDLQSAGLENILLQSRIDRRAYELISYSGVGIILLLLLGLLVRGLAVGMTSKAILAKVDEEPSGANSPLHLVPDEKALARIKTSLRIVMILSLMLFGALAYLIGVKFSGQMAGQLILPSLGFFAVAAVMVWVSGANAGTSISVSEDLVTLKDHSGHESTCPISEVRYDDSSIATHDAVVHLGRPPSSVYKRENLTEDLFPRISGAQRVSAFQMQKILIEQRHPQGLITVLSVLALIAYAIWTFVT